MQIMRHDDELIGPYSAHVTGCHAAVSRWAVTRKHARIWHESRTLAVPVSEGWDCSRASTGASCRRTVLVS